MTIRKPRHGVLLGALEHLALAQSGDPIRINKATTSDAEELLPHPLMAAPLSPGLGSLGVAGQHVHEELGGHLLPTVVHLAALVDVLSSDQASAL